MTNNLAISAHNLGKRYRRGSHVQHNSIRDALYASVVNLVKSNGEERKSRETFWALRDASFEIAKGENVGIIGLNGAGKSTLLKIISRITTPTTGSAQITGRLGALLEVGTGFHGELTGRENIYLYGSILGMSRKEVSAKFDAIVEFSEIKDFIDTPVKRYSSGMYVRLAFAVAAHLDPDILLLDEVLAVGDFTFQRKCMDFARQLEKKGSTILFVSHNMFSIKAMCPRVIYLRRGQIVFDGATDEGLRLYEEDSRLAVAPWFHASDGPAAIRIKDIALTSESGEERTVFNFGERMAIRIRYETSRPIERPDFRIGIDRFDEVHCNSFSTFADRIAIPSVNGEGTVEMTSPPIKLVSDLYNLTVSVRERGTGQMLCAQIGPRFHVRHPLFASNAYGVFHEPADWKVHTPALEEAS